MKPEMKRNAAERGDGRDFITAVPSNETEVEVMLAKGCRKKMVDNEFKKFKKNSSVGTKHCTK